MEMTQMKKKYIFFDIDGTLAVGVPGKQYVPDSAKEAIARLRENGHFVAIATGRSYAMAYEHMVELGFENMVHDGGNGITIDNKLLGITPLDYDKCIELIEECKRKDFIWAMSPDNATRRLAPDERFYQFTQDTYMKTEVKPDLNPLDYDKIYKLYIACNRDEEMRLDALKGLPWCRFHDEYLFVEPNDKSVGIKAIVDHLGGDYKDVVVFGDEVNDLSMFIDEWTSVAMGNAIEELKAKASYITDDNDKDGIYKACRHLRLI